jgi:hypothetical protein
MSPRSKIDCALGTITPITMENGIRYRLRATIDGKRESLGCFDTIDMRALSRRPISSFCTMIRRASALRLGEGSGWTTARAGVRTEASKTPAPYGIDTSSRLLSRRLHSVR